MWYVGPLLGNYFGINKYKTPIATERLLRQTRKQQLLLNRAAVSSMLSSQPVSQSVSHLVGERASQLVERVC